MNAPSTSRPHDHDISDDAAVAWLRRRLSAGPVAVGEVRRDAEAVGFDRPTLARARVALRVASSKWLTGKMSLPMWSLPIAVEDADGDGDESAVLSEHSLHEAATTVATLPVTR